MTTPGFRREAFKAFSFPVVVFVVLPYTFWLGAMLVLGRPGHSALAASLLTVLTVVAPFYLVGYVLAPWAGRLLKTSTLPAFVMTVVAALAAVISFGLYVTLWWADFSMSAMVAGLATLYALPASLLATVFFVGGCERLQNGAPAEQR